MSERDIKVQAIINPISGVGSKRKIPKMIEGICSKKNCSLNISFTEYAGHASELTRQAIEEGAEYILAVGGDGTVNEIARAMILWSRFWCRRQPEIREWETARLSYLYKEYDRGVSEL